LGWLWLAAAQNLYASTFIAALRHSEVKFGLTLCVWRSVSAQIRIIIQLFIITALAARREEIYSTHAESTFFYVLVTSSSARSSALFISHLFSFCVWLMPRQLSVSQDEHAPLSFPIRSKERRCSLHICIHHVCERAAGAEQHIYVYRDRRLIRLTVQFFECALRASNIKDLQSALQRSAKRGETKTRGESAADGRANANTVL
jgi:hypothetical protein